MIVIRNTEDLLNFVLKNKEGCQTIYNEMRAHDLSTGSDYSKEWYGAMNVWLRVEEAIQHGKLVVEIPTNPT